ncbi:hypothetical protein [Roseibium sediminicola]|uniref:Energy transducer TonB n=1 Tax=Roseibium sediminicola TaxID=2933272 RepID=A0ABT0GVR1_9HYPH|nr:hypothetical protein [Roseibium sp. CAU 1639]MCK7613536.1 hypothetical protein [Roseibium sp. CAU 1639]
MAYEDHKRYQDKSAFSSAGWFVAGGLAMALLAGALLYMEGYFQDDNELSIELNVPNLDADKIPLPDVPDKVIVPKEGN